MVSVLADGTTAAGMDAAAVAAAAASAVRVLSGSRDIPIDLLRQAAVRHTPLTQRRAAALMSDRTPQQQRHCAAPSSGGAPSPALFKAAKAPLQALAMQGSSSGGSSSSPELWPALGAGLRSPTANPFLPTAPAAAAPLAAEQSARPQTRRAAAAAAIAATGGQAADLDTAAPELERMGSSTASGPNADPLTALLPFHLQPRPGGGAKRVSDGGACCTSSKRLRSEAGGGPNTTGAAAQPADRSSHSTGWSPRPPTPPIGAAAGSGAMGLQLLGLLNAAGRFDVVPAELALRLNLLPGCSAAEAMARVRELAAAGAVPLPLVQLLQHRLAQRQAIAMQVMAAQQQAVTQAVQLQQTASTHLLPPQQAAAAGPLASLTDDQLQRLRQVQQLQALRQQLQLRLQQAQAAKAAAQQQEAVTQQQQLQQQHQQWARDTAASPASTTSCLTSLTPQGPTPGTADWQLLEPAALAAAAGRGGAAAAALGPRQLLLLQLYRQRAAAAEAAAAAGPGPSGLPTGLPPAASSGLPSPQVAWLMQQRQQQLLMQAAGGGPAGAGDLAGAGAADAASPAVLTPPTSAAAAAAAVGGADASFAELLAADLDFEGDDELAAALGF